MVTVIERTAGRYEVQDVEFGRVYRWHPGCVIVECDCGERLTLTSSRTTCRCGADHTAFVGEQPGDEALHPWRSLHYVADTGIPY